MPPYLIKRYNNRKLYDTIRKRYVTLKDLSRLVATGKKIKVIDNETGADITSLTLSQIIYEQEKQSHSGFLPTNLLSHLIQQGEHFLERLPRSLRTFLNQNEKSLEDLVELWLQEGIIEEEDKERIQQDILDFCEQEFLQHLIQNALQEYPLPSKKEISKLKKLLSRLELILDHLQSKPENPNQPWKFYPSSASYLPPVASFGNPLQKSIGKPTEI